ncbi:heme-binding domain-containing protein [Nitratiruptor sp. SB155-2]|uniref:heme-binding domain-containing protein n=1 Tax=Nitratiruptor sp. (strain SB155-2) TaxID=387092 RepID=UPI000158708F|nr:heme-binding domain-containing protein [Nitratiruptor sp. SB155-2]BAF70860.1 cytochrome c [Nitratiruptor sp. SB155-2]
MRSFLMYLGALAVILGLLQFIPTYEKKDYPTDPKLEVKAPKKVMAIFKRSCYDCHSNKTNWPWYADVAPMSWVVRRDVVEGRKALNFSIWNSYSDTKKKELKKQIYRSVVLAMPLPQYLWLHPEAKLSKEDKKIIQDWASDGKGYIDLEVR